MTTAAEALRAAIVASAPVTAIVGQRVRFDAAGETDAFPFVVLRQAGDRPIRGIDGSLHAREQIFQVESWADTRSQAAQLHRLIESALVAAEMEPQDTDPDALDPELGARACVWTVSVWTDD